MLYNMGMDANTEQRRDKVGAYSAHKSGNGRMLEAVLLVAVVLVTGYVVGLVASGVVREWWETMPV